MRALIGCETRDEVTSKLWDVFDAFSKQRWNEDREGIEVGNLRSSRTYRFTWIS